MIEKGIGLIYVDTHLIYDYLLQNYKEILKLTLDDLPEDLKMVGVDLFQNEINNKISFVFKYEVTREKEEQNAGGIEKIT